VFGIFAGTYYWFPKVTGRLMNEKLGRIHFYITYLGVHAIFFPMHWVGMSGNPRRYADFTEFEFLREVALPHKFMTHSALFTAAMQSLFFINLIWSLKRGAPAGENPWGADTLEWREKNEE
jgi:cytochrome c oxidase subunit I